MCNSTRSGNLESKSFEGGMEYNYSYTTEARHRTIGLCGKSINNNTSNTSTSDSGEVFNGENFLGVWSQELIAKGSELLKHTRKGNRKHPEGPDLKEAETSFS
ncbi:hypothetical protein LR48_Vigan10g083100 [Vigna angularis]|uniref:Uncharacterized protein n=1 Tax=Phaseolus angularis TaxID=3914 RepID=A0A0L9VJR9_PHAAN|nr:hypothetical protein LR48_Vigan10g083100 [Vigna angularis]